MARTLSDTHGIDCITDNGHGTAALGPSDSTDSGSDITGAPGVVDNDILPDNVEVVPGAGLDDSETNSPKDGT